jgi:hypothetical protein
MSSNPPKKSAKSPRNAATVVPKKAKTDWEAVERDYRTGKYTLRELEKKHHVSYAQISRKASILQWTKDLRQAIKQATDAALLQVSVTEAQKNVTETIVVAAEVAKNVIVGHRVGLNRITTIKGKLLNQIEQAVDNMADLAEIIEMVRNPDENGVDRANDALKKVMSRSTLVDDLKKLADVDEKVRKGEREAHNIESQDDTPDSAKPKRIRLEFIDVEAREI